MAKKTVTISRKPSGTGADEPPSAAGNMSPLPPGLDEEAAKPSGGSCVSTPSGSLGRAVYGTVYCVSYGVVFSALMIGKLIPGSGLIGRALCDGAGEARHRFEERNEAAASQVLEPARA